MPLLLLLAVPQLQIVPWISLSTLIHLSLSALGAKALGMAGTWGPHDRSTTTTSSCSTSTATSCGTRTSNECSSGDLRACQPGVSLAWHHMLTQQVVSLVLSTLAAALCDMRSRQMYIRASQEGMGASQQPGMGVSQQDDVSE